MSPQQLEQTLHRLIPISAAMGIRVATLEPERLVLTAPLDANRNHAGSGFAGSIYSLACLAGWAFLRQLVERERIDAELVIGEGRIRYQRPLLGELRAELQVDAASQTAVLDRLRAGSPAQLRLSVHLPEPAEPAAVFNGIYFAKPR